MMKKCPFCGRRVHRIENAFRSVSGWERKRVGGGTNMIALREPGDVWAHAMCVKVQKEARREGAKASALR